MSVEDATTKYFSTRNYGRNAFIHSNIQGVPLQTKHNYCSYFKKNKDILNPVLKHI